MIGASGGIGSAICKHLRAQLNVGDVVALSRNSGGLDLLDEGTVAAAAEKLSGKALDLIVCATGALTIHGRGPEKSLREIDPEAMLRQFHINAVGPALVAKHFLPRLNRQSRKRTVKAVFR